MAQESPTTEVTVAYPNSSKDTRSTIERNRAYIAEQNGLGIAGHLARLSHNLKADPTLLEKMNASRIINEKSPQISKRLFEAARKIALNHDPNSPISFQDFESKLTDYNLSQTDLLLICEHMIMYREANRSKQRTLNTLESQENLSHDWTGLLTRTGFLMEVSNIRTIKQKKQTGSLVLRRGNHETTIPPFAAMDGTTLLVDLDDLREINKRYGHNGGDDALADVSAAVLAEIRNKTDLAIRYGGDEILVLLAKADPESARAIDKRIREKLSLLRKGKFPVTISTGAGRYHVDDLLELTPEESTFKKLISEADFALYKSKQRGKNQLTVMQLDPESTPTPPPPHLA